MHVFKMKHCTGALEKHEEIYMQSFGFGFCFGFGDFSGFGFGFGRNSKSWVRSFAMKNV